MAVDWDEPIGRVLRSSTGGFAAGARLNQLESPAFGAVVKALPRLDAREVIYGLLYDITIDDDPLVRQMVLADTVSEEMIRDQRHHRLAPVEMRMLAIGYRTYEGLVRHALPPRPPLSLDPVLLCPPDEVREVTERFDYFRIVLDTPGVPSEQLLAANLLYAAQTRPEAEQYAFLVAAGREVARLLGSDLGRLDHLLRLIYPA
ncbi:MAG: HAS-barrel domain-containing protein [Anaerolineae bacterium]